MSPVFLELEAKNKQQENNSKVRQMDGSMDVIGKELEANRTILDQASSRDQENRGEHRGWSTVPYST